MAKRDYYEVLGVPRTAAEDDIKKAYRKLAFESHPDRNPGDAAAEKRFKEATEAYEVLRDREQRARYDQFGHVEQGMPGGGAGGFDFSGFDLADALRAFMRDFGDEGGGGGGFGDLFGGGGRVANRRGDDLQVRLKLTLEEIASGVEKRIRVRHLKKCATCDGRGGQGETQCPQCQGRGRVRRVQQSLLGQFVNISACPQCGGEGSVVEKPCPTCLGDGRTPETETISVNVPKGVAEGNFIPLRGMGDAGVRSAAPGDLIVLIEEIEHAVFKRHGNDLLLEIPIGYATAVQGGKIEVPALDGKSATLDIPSGTTSGQALRVRGRGLPGLRGGRGDLIVRVSIWVPNKVGAPEKKILEEMKRSGVFTPPPPDQQPRRGARDAVAG